MRTPQTYTYTGKSGHDYKAIEVKVSFVLDYFKLYTLLWLYIDEHSLDFVDDVKVSDLVKHFNTMLWLRGQYIFEQSINDSHDNLILQLIKKYWNDIYQDHFKDLA